MSRGSGTGWLWRGTAVVAAALAFTLAARYLLIEPMGVAAYCEEGGGAWFCPLREALVVMFVKNLAGMASVLTGVWSTITRSRTLAFAALTFGMLGMVLYRFDSAVIGVLLGALVVAREAAGSVEHTSAESHREAAEG